MQAKSYSNCALHWIKKIDVESTMLKLLAVVSRFLITVKRHHGHLTPLHLRGCGRVVVVQMGIIFQVTAAQYLP